MHKKSISHRDIKLENIIISKTEPRTIKLIDFGFAVFSKKPLKLQCGTSLYMSPEIMTKSDYFGWQVDMWTAGILFYVLLTGKFPFIAHTDRERTRKLQKGIYSVPREFISADAERVIS